MEVENSILFQGPHFPFPWVNRGRVVVFPLSSDPNLASPIVIFRGSLCGGFKYFLFSPPKLGK